MFNKIFSKSTSNRNVRPDVRADVPIEQQLAQAQQALQKLRSAGPGDSDAFPLLNESTRVVQQLEVTVSRLPHDDMRDVWRAQLDELQGELKSLTERVLNSYTAAAPRVSSHAAGPPQPSSGAAARPPRMPSPTPPGRTHSLSPRSHKVASPHRMGPAADVPEDVALFDDMDLFSGLSIAEGMDGPTTSAPEPPRPSRPPSASYAKPSATAAIPARTVPHATKADEAPPLSSSRHSPSANPSPANLPQATIAVSTATVTATAHHDLVPVPSSPSSAHPASPTHSTSSTISSAAPSASASAHTLAASPRQGSGVRAPLDETWFTSLADPEPEPEPAATEDAKPTPEPTTYTVSLPAADLEPPSEPALSSEDSTTLPVHNLHPVAETITIASLHKAKPPPVSPAAAAPVHKSKKGKKKTSRVRVGYAKSDDDDDDDPHLDPGLHSHTSSGGIEGSMSAGTELPVDQFTATPVHLTDADESMFASLDVEGPVPSQAEASASHQRLSQSQTDHAEHLHDADQPSSIGAEAGGSTGKVDASHGSSARDSPRFDYMDGSATSGHHDGFVDAAVAPLPADEAAAAGPDEDEDEDAPATSRSVEYSMSRSAETNAGDAALSPVSAQHPTGHEAPPQAAEKDRAEDQSEAASTSAAVTAAPENSPTNVPEPSQPSTSSDAPVPDSEAVTAFFSQLSGDTSTRVAAARMRVGGWVAVALACAKQQQETEHLLGQQRRAASAELAKVSSSISKVEEEQAVAVEVEDFERADHLNTGLEALIAEQQELQQQVKLLDVETAAISSNRIQLVARKAELHIQLAEFLENLAEERRFDDVQLMEAASKEQQEAESAKEAAEGRVEVMQSRIAARHKVLEEEQAQLDEKIAFVTKPAVEERQQLEAKHSKLQAEVEKLERQLAAKRAELEASSARMEQVDARVRALASKFDKRVADIEADKVELAADEEVLRNEVEALQKLQEEADTKQQEFDMRHSILLAEVEELLAAGSKARAEASSIQEQISDEAGAKKELAQLRAASQEAQDRLQELVKCVEEVKGQVSSLAAQCAHLAGEKAAAEEKVAEAQRRIPEIEADKKAAAAKKDFKEAARLSAESKAMAAQAEKQAAEAKQAAAELENLDAEQAALSSQLEELDGMLNEASREAGIARWRCLDSSIKHTRKRLEAAVENEQYDEAELLQEDIDTDMVEAKTLMQQWNLAEEERGVAINAGNATVADTSS